MKFDVVIIGGGLAGMTAGLELLGVGKSCVVVSAGLSLNETPRSEYIRSGGLVLDGDRVLGGKFEGNVLKYVNTANLGETRLEAEHFILATGKFFSMGLCSDMHSVYEPVFGCDVAAACDRSEWTSADFFSVQPFESFGVVTDSSGRVSVGGKTVSNLYAAGEILCGRPDIRESALKVCRNII